VSDDRKRRAEFQFDRECSWTVFFMIRTRSNAAKGGWAWALRKTRTLSSMTSAQAFCRGWCRG
jgi:hypothetical protein